MNTQYTTSTSTHSSAWIAQTWLSFAFSITATAAGILYLPVDGWIKGYLGMGLMFSIGSTVSLTKTTRDLHEAKRLVSRVEEAKIEKILSEHSPLK